MARVDLRALIEQLRNLDDEQLVALQTQVDVLEQRARSSHHETTSHHHTTALLDFPLPNIAQLAEEQRKR
jgi:hypothetical protein